MALIVGGAAAVAVGVMYEIRRRSPVDHFFIEVERGAGVFAFIGTAYAVLLAFVVLEAFQSFNDAKTGAEEEATTVVQMSRTAEFFPPAERDPTEGVLICYGRAVVHEEWPAMKGGTRSPIVQGWVNRLEEASSKCTPPRPRSRQPSCNCSGNRTNGPTPAVPASARRTAPAGTGLVHPRPRRVRDHRLRHVLRRPA